MQRLAVHAAFSCTGGTIARLYFVSSCNYFIALPSESSYYLTAAIEQHWLEPTNEELNMASEQRVINKMRVVRLVETDEWLVKCWDQFGKRWEAVEYYAIDKQDAIDTMASMQLAKQESSYAI